jgi:hypothetical protein
LSLGTVFVSDPLACSSSGWYRYRNPATQQVYVMNCFGGQLQNCPNADDLYFTYASMNPVGIVPNVTQALGVVVFLTGSGGTAPIDENVTGSTDNELLYIGDYFTAGYVIVQLAWSTDWELTTIPSEATQPPNIQNAACRPATFLNWIYNNIYQPVYQANSKAGMCAQAGSAGSAAVGYSLAFYGASAWLDNVELISGPVLSNIQDGCEEPPPVTSVTVCGSGDYWCKYATGSSWSFSPTYVNPGIADVQTWTNPSCAVPNTTTSSYWNGQWLDMSIVDTNSATGATPTFTYNHTAMSGWLCRPPTANGSENNSSQQGELFYDAVGAASLQPTNFAVYPVDNCANAEGVSSQTSIVSGAPGSPNGIVAIENDTIGSTTPLVPAQCVRHH